MATFIEVLGEDLAQKVTAAVEKFNAERTDKVKFVDLSEGGYVSKEKYENKVNSLTTQVNDMTAQIGQRDTDMADLKKKLEAAAADSTKLTEAQQTLLNLQTQYDQEKTAWETKLKDQAYEFRIRELAGSQKFSSNAAKNEFIREAVSKKFPMDGDKVTGFEEYLKDYKAADPGAFIAEESGKGSVPEIVHPSGGPSTPPGATMTLTEAMKRANAGEKIDIASIK